MPNFVLKNLSLSLSNGCISVLNQGMSQNELLLRGKIKRLLANMHARDSVALSGITHGFSFNIAMFLSAPQFKFLRSNQL